MSGIYRRAGFVSAWGYLGNGYLAGQAPASPAPEDPDGRAKILNVPSRVRIVAFDRATHFPVSSTLSGVDGTWRISSLDENRKFFVVGFDDRGLVNAAIQDWITPHVEP